MAMFTKPSRVRYVSVRAVLPFVHSPPLLLHGVFCFRLPPPTQKDGQNHLSTRHSRFDAWNDESIHGNRCFNTLTFAFS